MRATEFVTEDAMMGKLEDSGKIVRILKKAHTVPFSDEKNWLLIDTDPAKGNKGLGLKWVPADTRFTWVRPYRDSMEEDSLTEIEKMDQSQYRGGKDTLDRYSTPGKKHLRALPGGSDLMYSITSDAYGSYVHIVDPGIPGITKPSIVASLSLVKGVIPNSVQVGAITVDEDYRGRGLAKALYGIVLTIMKKTLISGSSQTPGGRRNWLSLASIPGVEIKGLLDLADFQLEKSRQVDNTMDQLMQLGGQFVAKNNNYTYWAFDVVPGNGQLAPAVKNKLSKLYGYDSDNLLMATWTGGQQDVSEAPAGYKEIEFVCVNPQFPDATDPALQKKMYRGLKQIDGVVPLWQEWGDYSEGQASLSAIYQGSKNRDKILSLAKQLGVEVDLEQAVSDDYVDRAMRGEHEGQQGLTERKQSPLEDFEGLQFRMVNDNGQLFVNAFDSSGVNELGHVTFDIGDGKELDPQNLYVKHKFRSQGIARLMYDFVKSKGYKIQRSWDQTDAGAGFWDKHRGEERVWENFADGKNPQDKGDSVRHGIPKNATMAELEKASHAAGRKGQLARWQLNMRRGHKK